MNAKQFITGRRDKEKREVASLTKIMTFYTVMSLMNQFGLKLKDTYVRISINAAAINGTTAYLRIGDVLTVWDLLHGLMLPSGNDAAYALAEFFGEILMDEEEKDNSNFYYYGMPINYFLREMNRNGKLLGLKYSNFDSPHGLSNSNNFSCAFDMAKLSSICMNKFKEF